MTEAQWPEGQDETWEDAFAALEENLLGAMQALSALRRTLSGGVREPVPLPSVVRVAPGPTPVDEAAEAPLSEADAEETRTASAFERLWERIEHERAQQTVEVEEQLEPRRGLDLLPQQYLMTVEDREGRVDLVTMHRALLAVPGVDEFSLVSFANGVPVISLRVQGEIDTDRLAGVVSKAMQRPCEMIPQDNARLFLRLKSNDDGGG
jgi:hypothetical protein